MTVRRARLSVLEGGGGMICTGVFAEVAWSDVLLLLSVGVVFNVFFILLYC